MNKPLFPDVTVNGEVISQADIAAEAQHHSGPAGKPGIAWRKAANALVIRALLLQEAARRGLQPDVQERAPGKFETPQEALIRGLLEDAIEVPAPTEDELRAAWQADPSRFASPPLWEVSHILCACDMTNEAARETARVRAIGLIEIAVNRPRGFAKLAAAESDCSSKSCGGALGQLGPGDTVPEFEAALRAMHEGEISAKPVATRHGYHIIRLDALAERRELPFAAVRDKIAMAMEQAGWTKAAREFTEDLIDKAEITGIEVRPVQPTVRNTVSDD